MSLIDVNWNPDRRQLRAFAVLWLVVFGLLGAYLAWHAGAFSSGMSIQWRQPWRTPILLWLAAASVGLTGMLVPNAVRPIYVVWMGLAFPIGWMVSHFLLGLTYFGLFTTFAVVFRVIRRDALHRAFDRSAKTYWIDREPRTETRQYFKQF